MRNGVFEDALDAMLLHGLTTPQPFEAARRSPFSHSAAARDNRFEVGVDTYDVVVTRCVDGAIETPEHALARIVGFDERQGQEVLRNLPRPVLYEVPYDIAERCAASLRLAGLRVVVSPSGTKPHDEAADVTRETVPGEASAARSLGLRGESAAGPAEPYNVWADPALDPPSTLLSRPPPPPAARSGLMYLALALFGGAAYLGWIYLLDRI
jgi:hypothetical protein